MLDNIDVARLYLASHVLLNQGGEPFQDIIDELSPDEAPSFRQSLQSRRYNALAPKDAAAARQELLEIVDLATEQLQMKMEVLSQIAELDAASAADRASWDDSSGGRAAATLRNHLQPDLASVVRSAAQGTQCRGRTGFRYNRVYRANRPRPQYRRERHIRAGRRNRRHPNRGSRQKPRSADRSQTESRNGAERSQF